MPEINFPEFDEHRGTEPKQLAGIFVGGCVERGDGSSFRAKAHAHTHKTDAKRGWICVRSAKRIRTEDGKPTNLMKHELAHILTGQGHTQKWAAMLRQLGGRVAANELGGGGTAKAARLKLR